MVSCYLEYSFLFHKSITMIFLPFLQFCKNGKQEAGTESHKLDVRDGEKKLEALA